MTLGIIYLSGERAYRLF